MSVISLCQCAAVGLPLRELLSCSVIQTNYCGEDRWAMSDVLIITSRNVVTSGGEFSLIKNRARALEDNWGITSDVVALCNTRLNVAPGTEAFGSGEYVRCDFMNPISLLSGYKQLISRAEALLKEGHYRAALLSGVGVFRYVGRLKRCVEGKGTLICADVHGYYGDGAILSRDEPFLLGSFHRLASAVEEFEQRRYLRLYDRIFTVSRAYRKFLCETAGCKYEQFYIVPCATGSVPNYSADDVAANRSKYRQKYSVDPDEALLVYSGGASSWQCLPQTVQLYQQIKSRIPARLLILSGDTATVRHVVGNVDDVLIDSYQPCELPEVFCAADYFIMLREDVPTNHFAYPNKFLEYVAAHRPVITTPFVLDIAEEIEANEVGIIYDGDMDRLLSRMRDFSLDPASCDCLVRQVSFGETLRPFVHDLGVGLNL